MDDPKPRPAVQTATLSSAHVEVVLAVMMDIGLAHRKAFEGRLRHLIRLGLPVRASHGRGRPARYDADDFWLLVCACELLDATGSPQTVVDRLVDEWPELRRRILEMCRTCLRSKDPQSPLEWDKWKPNETIWLVRVGFLDPLREYNESSKTQPSIIATDQAGVQELIGNSGKFARIPTIVRIGAIVDEYLMYLRIKIFLDYSAMWDFVEGLAQPWRGPEG